MSRSVRMWSWHGELVYVGAAGDIWQQELFAPGQSEQPV